MSNDWLNEVSTPDTQAPAAQAAPADASWLNDVSTPDTQAPADNSDQNDRRIARGSPGADEGQPTLGDRLSQMVTDVKGLPDRSPYVKEFTTAFGPLNLNNNMFVKLNDYWQSLKGISAAQNEEWGKQVQNGQTKLSFEDWLDKPENSPINIYQAEKGTPDTSANFSQASKEMVNSAMAHPAALLGAVLGGLKEMVNSAMAHPAALLGAVLGSLKDDPELLIQPELGLAGKLAEAGKIAEAVGRGVEGAANMGAQSAAISAAQQLKATGGVQGAPTAVAGALGAATGFAMMGTHAALESLNATAMSLGKRIITDGKPMSPQMSAAIDTNFNNSIVGGKSPTDAFVATMKQFGMDPTKAEDIGDVLGTAEAVLKESKDATQQQGPKDTGGNAEDVRAGQGDDGVLRQPGVGADQAGGGSIASKNQSTDPGPPDQSQLDQTEVGGTTLPKIEDIPKPTDLSQPIDFTPSGKKLAPIRSEVPDENGNIDPRLHPDEYFHTTDTPGITELDPAFSKPGNKYGDAVSLTKDYALSRAHKPTSIVDGELRETDPNAGETQIATFDRSNTFDTDKMFPPGQADAILGAPKNAAGEALPPRTLPTSGATIWKQLVKKLGGKNEAKAHLQQMGFNGVSEDAGDTVHSWVKVASRPNDIGFMPVKERMPNTKVVDATGEPKVLYHGTDGAFARHRRGAVFATDDPAAAHSYAMAGGTNKSPNIRPTYMNLENPKHFDAQGKSFWGQGNDNFSTTLALHQAIEEGHDGAIIHNLRDAAGEGEDVKPSTVYIAKSAKQVYTAMGKQAGFADPKQLAAIGLAGLAGAGVYALTGDKWKAVAAAAAAGLLPFARSIVSRVRIGNVRIIDAMKDQRVNTKAIFRDNAFQRTIAIRAADNWQRATTAMLKGEPDIKASMTRVRDYVQGHRDVPLSPRELATAGEVTRFLDTVGQRGLDAKVLRNTIEDYLPGLYQQKPFKSVTDLVDALTQNDAYRGNYTGMSLGSKHAMQKIIPDYRTVDRLVASGKLDVIPLTHDPMEMAALYAKSLAKTISNKTLIDTLKKTPGPDFKLNAQGDKIAQPLVLPITPTDAAAKILQTLAIVGKQFDLPVETMEMMKKFAVMSAPKDYVPISHPALEGMRVHQDVAGPLKLLFDTNDPGVITKSMLATSMLAKTALFSFSLFHAGSLGLNVASLAAASPIRMWRGLAGARAALLDTAFHPELVDAMKAGLMMAHRMDDVDPSVFQRALNLADAYVSSIPGGRVLSMLPKGVAYAQKAINHFMWEVLHPTLKLGTFMAERARWQDQLASGTAKVTDHDTAMRQIATGVNDIYGGLNWFELANNVDSNMARQVATALFSPQGRRWQQILMLAPDWNIAALRTWYGGAKAAAPGIDPKASDHLYKTYLMSSALMYLGAAYGLQKYYTGENLWDKDDWSYVDMGDGRKIQLNKHFMEGIHMLTSPSKFIINKMGYLPKEAMAQLFGRDYVTYNSTTGSIGPPMADKSVLGRAEHAAKALVSPITVSNLGDPASAASGFFGVPIYGKNYAAQATEAGEKAEEAGKTPAQVSRAEKSVLKRQARDDAKREANREKASQ
jgi:hypothetical protein